MKAKTSELCVAR